MSAPNFDDVARELLEEVLINNTWPEDVVMQFTKALSAAYLNGQEDGIKKAKNEIKDNLKLAIRTLENISQPHLDKYITKKYWNNYCNNGGAITELLWIIIEARKVLNKIQEPYKYFARTRL